MCTQTAGSSTRPAPRTRPLLSFLGDPWFSTAMRWLFLVLSAIMVWHNVFFQSWGIGTFPSITRRMVQLGEDGRFDLTPLFDADGKPSFLQYARTPAGRFLHMFPAGLWSVIAPLQLSPTFRSKHRTAHRRLGRLFIAMSVSMSFGLLPIILGNVTKLEEMSVYSAGIMLALGAYFLAAAMLAINHARKKRMSRHRVWILRHVAMGYSVHLQRLLGYLTWWAFPRLVPGYTDLTPEGARVRSSVFGTYFLIGVVLSVGSMELWLRHTPPSGAFPRRETDKGLKAT